MQAIMEPLFEIPYLIGVVVLGILILRRAKGRRQFVLFGIMAIVLGVGDAFHLVPRSWYLLTTGTAALPEQAAATGAGKMITSITMTGFYVLLYHVWQMRYQVKKRSLMVIVYLLAAVRVFLCLLPQNQWLSPTAPLSWGIYRNIPFVGMGLVIIGLYAVQTRRSSDKAFRFMGLAIALSFILYIPVVLFADTMPLIGMLMIPKTCAYIWIILMGYKDAGRTA